MNIFMWVWLALFCILLLALLIGECILYGIDLGTGYCDNFIDWLKKNHKFNKEWNAEQKAYKAFLKANPLCKECQLNGKYVKAKYCNHVGNLLVPVCSDHYVSTYDRHKQEAQEMQKKQQPRQLK